MKDSRIGVWGVAGILFLVLIKWEILVDLPLRPRGLLVAMILSRWSHVFLSTFHPYAGMGGGLGSEVARKVDRTTFYGAGAFAMAVVLIGGWVAFFSFISVLAFLGAMGIFLRQKIGGITGDVLGAAGEMAELLVLACFWVSSVHF